MADSAIEWTDATWNPVTGCTRASAGCDHCYAVTMTHRLEAMGQEKYSGLTVLNGKGDRHFNGQVRTHDDALTIPLRWKKPRRVFVNSMSDLFHKDVPFEFVDKVFAVMALCPKHTFQILTKRPERMEEYLSSGDERRSNVCDAMNRIEELLHGTMECAKHDYGEPSPWPLPGVWLGTSIENQKAADERIPHLLKCPAAVRFLSMEPLIGVVDLSRWLPCDRFYLTRCEYCGWTGSSELCGTNIAGDDVQCAECGRSICGTTVPGVDWVIVGGESGPGARPCDVDWIRSIVQQCKSAGVACFVKQLGANIRDRNDVGFMGDPDDAWGHDGCDMLMQVEHNPDGVREEYQGAPVRVHLRDKKGGDPSEWPLDLRVREMPVRPGSPQAEVRQ